MKDSTERRKKVMYCKKRFKRVNGYAFISDVIRDIEMLDETDETVNVAA